MGVVPKLEDWVPYLPIETYVHKETDRHIPPATAGNCSAHIAPNTTHPCKHAVLTGNKRRMGAGLSAARVQLPRSPGGLAAGHCAHCGRDQPLKRNHLCLQPRVPLCLPGKDMHARSVIVVSSLR